MRLNVRYLDGSEAEVVVTASARRAFESKHEIPLLRAMTSGRAYWSDELAHSSLVQTTDEDREFDEWMDTVETILWQAPAERLAQIAQALGVQVTTGEVEAVRPTGGAEKAPSRAKSSKPRSTRASRSKD